LFPPDILLDDLLLLFFKIEEEGLYTTAGGENLFKDLLGLATLHLMPWAEFLLLVEGLRDFDFLDLLLLEWPIEWARVYCSSL